MSCLRWRKWTALYVGGDLEDRRRLKLERHLDECSSCRDLEHDLRSSLGELRSLDAVNGAGDILGSIHGEVMQVIADRQYRTSRFGLPRFALMSAAAAAVVILAVLFRQSPVEQGPREAWQTAATPIEAAVPVPASDPLIEPTVDLPPEPESVSAEPAVMARNHLTSTGPTVELRQPVPTEPMTIKILTADPEVVIYWIVDPKGDNENV